VSGRARIRSAWVLLVLLTLGALATRRVHAQLPSMTNSLGQVLLRLPAGVFLMGSPKDYAGAMAAQVSHDWYRNSPPSEAPQRRVRISQPFWIGAHEVTVGEFRRFVQAARYETDAERDGRGGGGRRDGKWIEQASEFFWDNAGYPRAENEPVNNVSWNDAVAFCAWLSRHERATYRLPSEAEWEYACRAGTTNACFWGEDDARRDEFVWSAANAGGKPHPVGQLKPNPWGLFDINGNVYEYTADGWATNLVIAFGSPAAGGVFVDPRVRADGDAVTLRSASWGTAPMHCRSAFRGSASKTHRNHRDGFRIARELDSR
jgi:formylglycine-generating enzyme required for sulfatase activity